MDSDNRYGMRETHLALLKMLDNFLQLCRENNIVFSMGFGSMLGAVRHKGFIPWDDDIDLIIDRDNYAALIPVLEKSSEFEFQRWTKDTLWIPRIKQKQEMGNIQTDVYLPTIDLFLVDNVPDKPFAAKMKKLCVLFIQGMIKKVPNLKKGSFLTRLASLVCFFLGLLLPLSFKFWLLDKVSVISNDRKTACCSTYNVEYIYVGRKYDGRLLKELVNLPFEGRDVPVSKYFDTCLTELYGDYMTPPKDDERVPKHQ